jgi:hypothetical protein
MQSYTFDYDNPVQRPGYTMIFKVSTSDRMVSLI